MRIRERTCRGSRPGGPPDGRRGARRPDAQDSPGLGRHYGAPRITAELREYGERVNHKKTARAMRQVGLPVCGSGAGTAPPSRTRPPMPFTAPLPLPLRDSALAPLVARRTALRPSAG
ncbi:IS3 family transposase [Streptomyces sp. NPDC059153]|uniref:IS3 family transposase n=1 Tax=Streptomyces sp. NPDC059153 TaxID=3346743 RepID=UPI003699E61C